MKTIYTNLKAVILTLSFAVITSAGFAQLDQNDPDNDNGGGIETAVENITNNVDFDKLVFFNNSGTPTLQFTNNTELNVAINIYDVSGKLIISDNALSAEKDFNRNYASKQLSHGIYVVQLKAGNNIKTHKFYL